MIKAHDSIIVQKVSRILIPFIQVFAVYVLMNGHHSPGGGFQAGVLFGAAIILKLLIGSLEERKSYTLRGELTASLAGLFIYMFIGAITLFMGGVYLNYAQLPIPGLSAPDLRYYGILGIEVGVTVTVSMVLVIIFHTLALDDTDEGIGK